MQVIFKTGSLHVQSSERETTFALGYREVPKNEGLKNWDSTAHHPYMPQINSSDTYIFHPQRNAFSKKFLHLSFLICSSRTVPKMPQ